MKSSRVRSQQPLFDCFQELRIAVPSLLFGACLISKLIFDYQYSAAIDVSIVLLAAFPVALFHLYERLQSTYKKAGFEQRIPLRAVVGLAAGILLAFAFTQPAHALFFNDAETWSKSAFGDGAGGTDVQNAIKFVFNLFRFLMVAAILGTVAAVGFSLATDRDVSTIARVPAGFAAIFVIGDIFSSLLTKGATN